MTLAALPQRITPEELLQIPDNSQLELIDGKIVKKNVSAESSEIEAILIAVIQVFLQRTRVGKVYPSSLGYQCFADDPSRIRKPDVSVIRTERLTALPDPNPGFMPIHPDLAVEVISPNDKVYEVDEKIRDYLSAGVPLVWVVDPNPRTVTIHSSTHKPTILTDREEITAPNILPGFRCTVSEFFPPIISPPTPK